MKWVSFDIDTRIAYLTELLDYVRFEHMESDITSVVLNHHLVKNSELLVNDFSNCKVSWSDSRFIRAAEESGAETD